MENSNKKINSLIRSGVKIINTDTDRQEVNFLECVIIEDGKAKPFYTSIPVTLNEKFNIIRQSKRFKDSLFAPVDRGVLLMDVVGYSRYDTLYQASILSLFNQAIRHSLKKFKSHLGSNCLEQVVPTGDGCFIIFNECTNPYFLKAAYTLFSEMNKVQDKLVGKYACEPNACEKIYLRFSCTIDQTDFFFDPTGRRNCYGIGMNEAVRILKLGQEKALKYGSENSTYDSFFIDVKLLCQAEELQELLTSKNYNPVLTDLGIISDKHGIKRNIRWLHNLPPFKELQV